MISEIMKWQKKNICNTDYNTCAAYVRLIFSIEHKWKLKKKKTLLS